MFLLDTIHLPHNVPKDTLKKFVDMIFDSDNILKLGIRYTCYWSVLLLLGYQVQGDLTMFAKTWHFAADSLLSPKRVVDVKYFSEMVQTYYYIIMM